MTCIFAHLSFQTHDPTQPTKNTNFRPIPDPTQPNPRVNPTHGQLCIRLQFDCDSASHGSRIASNRSRIVVVTISCISKSHHGNAASQAATADRERQKHRHTHAASRARCDRPHTSFITAACTCIVVMLSTAVRPTEGWIPDPLHDIHTRHIEVDFNPRKLQKKINFLP